MNELPEYIKMNWKKYEQFLDWSHKISYLKFD